MATANLNRHVKPTKPIVISTVIAARAAERYELDCESGCHISTYSTGSHGYAQLGWDGRNGRGMVLAHRAAWVHFMQQQIPEGMTIDHLCKNRRCVNVAHLRMLNNFENARRTSGRDWPLGTCIRGHSNDLLRIDSTGKARCPLCMAEWRRRHRRRKALGLVGK